MDFKELSYANERDTRIKRWFIRSIEGLSGRDRYARLYDIWRSDIVGKSERIFGKMLDLIDVRLVAKGEWPPREIPDAPIVIVANHPFGIGDGIAVLALAEQLGRPFKVLINNELLKVPEMNDYSLPVSFEETKEAMAINMKTRHEAVRLLKEGTTIIVFPAGGVATAKKGIRPRRRPAVENLSGKTHSIGAGQRHSDLFRRAERPAVPPRQPRVDDAAHLAVDPRIPAPFRQHHHRARRQADELGGAQRGERP